MRVNKEQMGRTAEESLRVSRQASWAMLLLGLAGPVGGLVIGYGVARGLSRSIYRLSVRVKDLAGRLDQDVGSVSVAADGDLHRSTGRCRTSSAASKRSPSACSSTSATCCGPSSWPRSASWPPASPMRSATR